MFQIAYLDCPTGVAGDMVVGALIHAGVPLDYLKDQLGRLKLTDSYQLRAERVSNNGQQATRFHVDLLPTDANHHHQSTSSESGHSFHRGLLDIEELIRAAQLPLKVEEMSLSIFRQLAIAEGEVHGISPERVHFHEVGAVDAIVDIVGTCLGLDWLGVDRLYCSALPTGGGTVNTDHGRLPVPTPAVLQLWAMKKVPIYSNDMNRELVTPTGAAIVTTLASAFGSPPPMTMEKIGLGAGSHLLPLPNMLRLWLGQPHQLKTVKNETVMDHGSFHQADPWVETIAVLETQLDDFSPQGIAYTMDRLLTIGALDVFTQPIGMKKSRPGILLSVVCYPETIHSCEEILFQETTTLGIRRVIQERSHLFREIETVHTPLGIVRIKVAWSQESGTRQVLNVQPEYEDCAALAMQYQRPWHTVHQLALHCWQTEQAARVT